jgi:drug/metabolite transporter (DMT)-like permease
MQTGLILAIFSALTFSLGTVVVRKASAEAGESFSVMALSIIVGLPFFALAVTLAGDWDKVLEVSWRALALLAAAGVIHFILGRLLAYSSYRLIGANKATPFIMTNRFYTLIFAFLFLGESLTVFIVGGALLMFLGAALTLAEKKSVIQQHDKAVSKMERNGILLALAAALCWGFTPVLIKPGIEEMGSSIAGGFISYCAAGIVLAAMLMKNTYRRQITRLSLKSITPMAVAGLFTSAGQMLAYVALYGSPANVISQLLSLQVIFIFFLSWFFSRKSEIFTWKVALGMAATLVGTFLLFK